MGKKYHSEVDSLTGIRSDFYDEGDGAITINQTQDLEGAIEYAKECRLHGGANDNEEVWKHYAVIPAIVMHEMYQKGVDPCNDPKAAFQYINTHYPALKVTDKWHDDRRAKKPDGIIVK